MPNSNASDDHDRNAARRRAAIKQWAEYVRTHDDAEWSRQQNRLINSQLQTANDLARSGATDPVQFAKIRDDLRNR